jgi:hypothetical protein
MWVSRTMSWSNGVGGCHVLGRESDGAPASDDAGNEGGEVRRAWLMQVDLDLKRLGNGSRPIAGMQP